MNLAVDHPLVLLLLVFCIQALAGSGARWIGVSSLLATPSDAASGGLDLALRILSASAIAAAVIGLAGLHRPQQTVLRSGTGAHIVLVLDRSLSMDEPFALAGQKAQETKTAAAARIIDEFFARRPHDSFALIAFSTSPMLAMPLTSHREPIAAAMAAMHQKALANTDIGGGLSLALSLFAHDSSDATRVILFVSDGAGLIDHRVQDYIRRESVRQHAHLYYLYLRSGDDPSLAEDMTSNDTSHPAALDAFFHTLGIPYRGFEARDPGSIAAATDVIGKLESRPFTYAEKVVRVDLDGVCYAVAACCVLLVLLAQFAERDFTPAPALRTDKPQSPRA